MNSKYYLPTFCICSITFACLKVQSCPSRALVRITNRINAELIHTDTGLLRGIRVSWSWLADVATDCFQSPEVQLFTNKGQMLTENLNVSNHNNSVNFFHLDCNEMYTPRVRATYIGSRLFENGIAIFYGGSERSPPPILPRVCVGLSTLPELPGKVNISWELLPCHLQNGADIRGYIILYTPLPHGVAIRISSSSGSVECFQEFGGLYSCVVATDVISSYKEYSIQVAAHNNYGEGPFSDPVNISTPVSDTTCTSESDIGDGSTTSIPLHTSSNTGGGLFHATSMHLEIDVSTSPLVDVINATSIDSVIETSQTSANIFPFIAGGIVGILVLLGSAVVLMAAVLLMKRRKRQKPSNHTYYATISDLENKNSVEMVPDPDPPESKTSLSALKPTIEDIHDRSENEKDTPNKTSMKNVLYEPASEPKITDFQSEIHATVGEQVTLRINFTGIPKPTITWTFKGTKMEGDYATELCTDA